MTQDSEQHMQGELVEIQSEQKQHIEQSLQRSENTQVTQNALASSEASQNFHASHTAYTLPEYYERMPKKREDLYSKQGDFTLPGSEPYKPSQVQAGVQSNFGHGSGAPMQNTPSYFVPSQPLATPLPLKDAISQLPVQYWRVLTHPSAQTFAREMGKASWTIIWVQIVLDIVLTTVMNVLSNLFFPPVSAFSSSNTSSLPASTVITLQHLVSFISFTDVYGQALVIPILLFAGTGILFWLAKSFKGTGTFQREIYCTLLFLVPLSVFFNIVDFLLAFLGSVGATFSLLVALGYLGFEGVLLGLLLIPVHRLSGGRATGAVLLYYLSAVILTCILGFILATIFASSVTS